MMATTCFIISIRRVGGIIYTKHNFIAELSHTAYDERANT